MELGFAVFLRLELNRILVHVQIKPRRNGLFETLKGPQKVSMFSRLNSLQCRRILGGRNLVRVRNVVVAAIFDFMTVEDWGE